MIHHNIIEDVYVYLLVSNAELWFGLNDLVIRVRCLKSVQICDLNLHCIYSNQRHLHGSIWKAGGVYPSVARASGPAMHVPCSVV